MLVSDVMREITSEAELRDVLGVPAGRAVTKRYYGPSYTKRRYG